MHLKTYRHLWGVTDPLPEAFAHFAAQGYSGIEVFPKMIGDLNLLRNLVDQHHFEVIVQVLTGVGATVPTPEAHLEALKAQVRDSLFFHPVLFNVQGGLDCWSESEQDRFYEAALEFAATLDVPVVFETHRGQPTFTPWTTARILRTFPDLRLTCDFSHWVNVCERLLEDQEDHIRLAARHCIHIHARVGYEEGPQVTDPRAPDWERHLLAHERWWNWVWDARREQGAKWVTLTPEFGPPNHQHTLPYSQEPVGDLQEMCDWMAHRQRERLSALLQSK
ncbi:sugar phosphate isomerase/epimerase family protein [Deinococcus cellulosilyticus]|uniref:Xylose isomerase-like TIM barrel domain-containing protein n=1 Tax=Deinococcus cellulosilyticus (strain DSM 18568 / NBRC 106333 / KACC 11606 / 5516J-15) TaxID=1223518 RepID=A0A511N0B0_DEIC1|nr:TIM barrel protein [Deinococcus cellulosilyticus]GEM46320.1 hypothetical protein DC3_19550 [Deinococcus cellulosilyticus NBRC 106333 = KACC 11606]